MSNKGLLFPVLIFLVLTDLAILLNIPILRPALGFLFFTIVPGLLLLQLLRLNRLALSEKCVLSVGLSVSFLMFFGLLINTVYPRLGYITPLSTVSVLISFNAVIIVLVVVGYLRNKDSFLGKSDFELSTREKAFLLPPACFLLLSIAGMYLMNATGNNAVLMVMLFLIPAYIILIARMRHIAPERTYPLILFFIGTSVSLLLAMRSNHIIGRDTHTEFFIFQEVADSQRWQMLMGNTLDSTLSISLLPAMYQSLMNMNPEYLFKVLYPLLFSISPVAVYIISKKYIGSFYAFLGSFFFISQHNFIWTTVHSRTNLAILFLALVILVLFNYSLSRFARVLFVIIFAASLIVSHYSTTYIFFFMLLLSWLAGKILDRLTITEGGRLVSAAHISKGSITVTFVVLFLAMLFFWYGQAAAPTFAAGVTYVSTTLANLNQMFIIESGGTQAVEAFGRTLVYSVLPAQFKFIVYWLGVIFIVIGVMGTIVGYKKMVAVPGTAQDKTDLLESKIDVEYCLLSLAGCAVLALSVILPYVLRGYEMLREYLQMTLLLSLFFVIGVIMLAKIVKVKPHWLMLSVLLPYFMGTTGIVDQVFGIPGSVALNSQGPAYAYYYVYDREGYAARWLGSNASLRATAVYADKAGAARLTSQGELTVRLVDLYSSLEKGREIDGYVYLTHNNTVKAEVFDVVSSLHSLEAYQSSLIGKDKVYTNGGSEIYR